MSSSELTKQEVEAIIEIITAATDVTDFSLKYGMTEIRISRGQAGSAPAVPSADVVAPKPVALAAPTVPVAVPAASPAAASFAADEYVVRAPMVGTFYRSPAPLEPPFVEVGQKIVPNKVLCIIEVMKLMNSIQSERGGSVSRILVEDGQPVEFNQPLIVLKIDG
ncbi:MAG: acetyl-CoA carboxylase biotin carboxyl carrier protein [Rhizobiaceae bacterium]